MVVRGRGGRNTASIPLAGSFLNAHCIAHIVENTKTMGKDQYSLLTAWKTAARDHSAEQRRIEAVAAHDRAAARARDPSRLDGRGLRSRIDNLGFSYVQVARWLGLTVDGLHKQMTGARRVSPQTILLLEQLSDEFRPLKWEVERERKRHPARTARRNTAPSTH